MSELIANRYQLGSVVGTGGMSEVYAANDTLLGREVAVKMLRSDLALDATFRERFRKEAQNAGRLNHPAIVAVYDTGETLRDGLSTPYIVMELVNGRNLRDIVRDNGPLTPDEAATTLIPVCEALQASHDAGIIHRDIKPANVMITNTGVVKIMDFGIARALNDATSAMTQTSAVIGTAQYLSPEQARGKPVDGRSDIYALGCVMYDIITGRPPFDGDTPFAVAYQHVQEDATPPSEFIPDLTPTAALNVDAVVLTAMAKHPGDRYQTAMEMAADLQRLERNAVTMAARQYVEPSIHDPAPSEADTTVVPAISAQEPPATAQHMPTTQFQPTAASSNNQPVQAVAQDPVEYDEPEPQPKRTGFKVLVGVAAVAALSIVGAFTYEYFTNDLRGLLGISKELVTVPDLANEHRDNAVAQLEQLGLKVEITEEASPTVEKDNVIRTNPTKGSSVQSGTLITLMVSTGKEFIEVPDLSGKTTAEAAVVLKRAGLVLDSLVKEEASDTVEEGKIIGQNPPPGLQASKGSKVTITVSTGEATERIPVVTGMQWSQAEGNLTSLGFNPKVEYIDSVQPEGTVVSVAGEGTQVPAKTEVQVQVSNGSMIQMPNITNMVIDDALTELHRAGWKGTRAQISEGAPIGTGSLINGGRIANQTPAAGSPVRKDGTVSVQLWEFDISSLGQ
ncbi:serine/threonine protein kinase [Corynebacterium mustelae]|uniref:non-specific serine/threonine protein kinase n=1 Tax=Corynebacterium mustelae TaxID=571915 RepID=A0A0G3GV59_9CORY|nr:Stk1 family PASTA domain-containing Ser/Thr kinase [Corynebacterium mustelae]AKK04405.1 serine/threonine protein kinase [Corynebacterium mustelae]